MIKALLVAAAGLALAGPAAAAPRLSVARVGQSFVVVKASHAPRGARLVVRVYGGGRRRARLVRARVGRPLRISGLKSGTLVALRARRLRRGARFGRRLYVRTRAPAAVHVVVPPLQTGPLTLGISDSADVWNHESEFFSDAHALGMTTVRMILPWDEMQPDNSTPDFTTQRWVAVQRVYDRVGREGMRLMLSINHPPSWARVYRYGSHKGGAPKLWAWVGFARILAARFPKVAAWDWNEPGCCSIESVVPGADLAKMIDAAYPIWHAANAQTDVIMGSWCSCGSRTLPGLTQVSSIEEIGDMTAHPWRYGLDHAPRFDSWGLHLYGRPADYGRSVPTDSEQGDHFTLLDMERIGRVLDAAFPTRRVRFHISEAGWMSPGGYFGDAMSEDCQAAAVAWTLRTVEATPRAIDFSWFLLRDQAPNPATHNIWTTGLRRPDGSQKPSYGAWLDMVEGRQFVGSCATGGS